MQLSYFDNFLDALTFGDTGYAILLDSKGNILYHPDELLIGTKIESPRLANIASDYNNGMIESKGSFDYRYENANQIFAYDIMPDSNWVLLVKQDFSEIWSLTSIILLLLIIISAILLVLIIIFAHSLT